MIGAIYCMVWAGVTEATGSFWKGVLWPYHVGMVIGRAVEAKSSRLKS